MITKINDIYKRVAIKEGVDYELIKTMGDVVFSHLKEKMLSLDDTNLWVANFGYWVIKSKRIENQCIRYLDMRKYKEKKYPGYIGNPVGSFAKKLFSVYLNKIIKFKKHKKDFSAKQRQFCKNLYLTYKNNEDDNNNNTND